jgi:sec-independent protein translocase protein TatA
VFDAILQPTHLILILAVVLLVLGPKRLPGAGRALGQGLREFKSSIIGHDSDDSSLEKADPSPSPVATSATLESPTTPTSG